MTFTLLNPKFKSDRIFLTFQQPNTVSHAVLEMPPSLGFQDCSCSHSLCLLLLCLRCWALLTSAAKPWRALILLATGITHALGFKYLFMLKTPKCVHPMSALNSRLLWHPHGYLFVYFYFWPCSIFTVTSTLSLVVVQGFLIVVASLIVQHRL